VTKAVMQTGIVQRNAQEFIVVPFRQDCHRHFR
jgi:hypothetical protein